MDTNMYDQPTEHWGSGGDEPTEQLSPMQPLDQQNQASPVQWPVGAATSNPPKTTSKKRISRRAIVVGSVLGLAGVGVASAASNLVWQQLTHHNGGVTGNLSQGPITGNSQIGHLLRRAGFGANRNDLATYSSLGFSGAVDRLLNYQQVSDDQMESRLKALNLDLSNINDQQRWWLLRMAWTQRPLLEKMTLFWAGVLTSSFHKVGGKNDYGRMITQNQFLRTHAFDTYDNILLGITADPAMLFYLDLTKSTKNSPNENYARELMELFTLGLGHYTQQDVFEAAAALTGWHIKGQSSQYYPADHNNRVKTFLGQTGNFDYKDIVRILANHPQTPQTKHTQHITYFVYENPSMDDLKPLVDSYTQSGHNMGAVMRTLLNLPQFSAAQTYRNRIKSPVEFVVGAYRALDAQNDGTGLPAYTTIIGQTVFDPPNVAGWPGDKVSALWLNSGTWMSRLNYIDLLLSFGTNKGGKAKPVIDLQKIVNDNHISSPEMFVDYFSAFLLDGTVSNDRRTQFLDYFTTPETGRVATKITLTNGQSYPINRVRGTLYLIMASPEYQLN